MLSGRFCSLFPTFPFMCQLIIVDLQTQKLYAFFLFKENHFVFSFRNSALIFEPNGCVNGIFARVDLIFALSVLVGIVAIVLRLFDAGFGCLSQITDFIKLLLITARFFNFSLHLFWVTFDSINVSLQKVWKNSIWPVT